VIELIGSFAAGCAIGAVAALAYLRWADKRETPRMYHWTNYGVGGRITPEQAALFDTAFGKFDEAFENLSDVFKQ
jgi:hypothetical protein